MWYVFLYLECIYFPKPDQLLIVYPSKMWQIFESPHFILSK